MLQSRGRFWRPASAARHRCFSGHPAPDVVKTLTYRPEYFGAPMSAMFQEVMRGSSEWSIGDRELMAAFVSKTNECEF